MKVRKTIQAFLVAIFAVFSLPAWAVFSCSLSSPSPLNAVFAGAVNVDRNGSVVITCTRDPATDPATLSYRIKATDGTNLRAAAPFHRVRRGATADYLNYSLRRGTAVGGAATCGGTTTWRSPATGVVNVITGNLAFAAGAASASATWGYCIRVRSGGGNLVAPTPGTYDDAFLITAQYPNNDAGALSPAVTAGYSVLVNSVCSFVSVPAAMTFNYTAFGPQQSLARNFNLRCSRTLPWTLTVSPASNTLLGLLYNITLSRAGGNGTGANQAITATGTIPANQAGTCAEADGTCTATRAHTLTITY